MRSGKGQSRRRWPALAVGASLVVHAVLLATLPRVAPPALELAHAPMEIEVLTPRPDVEEPPQARHSPAAPAPAPPAPRPAGARPAPRQEGRPEPPADPSPLRMRAPNLLLDGVALDRLASEGIAAAPPPPATTPSSPPPLPRRLRWEEAAATRARAERARANVRDGKIHPQYYDVLRDADKAFSPPTAAIERDPRSPNTAGKTVRGWLRGFWHNYTAELERQGKDERAETDGLRSEDRPSGMLRNYNRLLRAAGSADQPIACRVCLVFRPGEAPAVRLETPSGNREIDRLAVEALTRAVARRPLEKDLLPGRADPDSVCYRFEARMGRIPPVPMVGCAFEETTLDFRCFYPLMKTFKTDVKLDGIQYRGG